MLRLRGGGRGDNSKQTKGMTCQGTVRALEKYSSEKNKRA